MRLTTLLLGISASSVLFVGANADNLTQVYQQALISDPVFMKAQADWLVARENFPLALTGTGTAGTGLFPNIAVISNYSKNYGHILNQFGENSAAFISKGYEVDLTQPIFNLATWLSISSARYTVKAATAQYLAAAENLMSRVANAYFEVLRANAKLTLTLAQKEQFLHQLITAEQKFKVGLIAITGVYDAQASYDKSIADEIKDRNDLQDRLEDLRAITGKKYTALTDLKAKIPLVMPRPQKMSAWVRVALKQNYTIQTDLNNMLASEQNIKVAATANVPTLNFTGSFSDVGAGAVNTPPLRGSTPNVATRQGSFGVALNFPVLRGGFDIANVKQQRYTYLSASDQLAVDHREVANLTRQAFLGIESGISQIKADKQAIISAKNQLEATKAGYIVGTRTMVNVLDSVTTLTQNQLSYADDRYNYVEGFVSLKEQAGTLSPQDIKHINYWLSKRIVFSLKQPIVKPRPMAKPLPSVTTEGLSADGLTSVLPQSGGGSSKLPPSSGSSLGSGSSGLTTPPSSPNSGGSSLTTPPSSPTPSSSSISSGSSVTTPKLQGSSAYGVKPKASKSHTSTTKKQPQTKSIHSLSPTLLEPSSSVTSSKSSSSAGVSSVTSPKPSSRVGASSVTSPKPSSRVGTSSATSPKPSSSAGTSSSTLPEPSATDFKSLKLYGPKQYRSSPTSKSMTPEKMLVPETSAPTTSPSSSLSTKHNFAIELFSSHHKRYAKRFYQQHKKGHQSLRLVQTSRNGKGWYRVTSGQYSNIHRATNALYQLPKSLKVYHPYVVYLPAILASSK